MAQNLLTRVHDATRVIVLTPSEAVQIVSPHRDDAAFSLALTIDSLAALGRNVQIINCFTITQYAPFSSLTSVSTISECRAAEDRLFAEHYHGQVSVTDLGHLDAPIRLHIPSSAVCKMHLPEEAELELLMSELSNLGGDGVILAPLALGNHVDHKLAKDAAVRTCQERAFGFYEDLPYAGRAGDLDAQVAALCPFRCAPAVCAVENGCEAKRSLISGYRSQATDAELDEIALFAGRYGAGERLWLTTQAQDSLTRAGLVLN